MSTNANFGWVPTVQEISNVDSVQIMHWMSTISCGHVVLVGVYVPGPMHAYGDCPKWCMVALEK